MKAPPLQLALFDAAGLPPFDIHRDAVATLHPVADFHVSGMDFKITHDGDIDEVLTLALDGLAALQRHDLGKHQGWLGGIGQLDVSPWELTIYATLRTNPTGGIVDVIQRGKDIEVNLPHPSLWAAHGLDWLLRLQRCCGRNLANRTPWLGTCCGCTPCT